MELRNMSTKTTTTAPVISDVKPIGHSFPVHDISSAAEQGTERPPATHVSCQLSYSDSRLLFARWFDEQDESLHSDHAYRPTGRNSAGEAASAPQFPLDEDHAFRVEGTPDDSSCAEQRFLSGLWTPGVRAGDQIHEKQEHTGDRRSDCDHDSARELEGRAGR
jgi:hypothetical protein